MVETHEEIAPLSSQPANSTTLPLHVQGLVKRFGQVTAVDGITLELPSGECLGLLGPNGAGKSTLIRSIVGRVIPDAGTITVFGAPADSTSARNALGWIPQELALYPRLTCRENLQSFGRYHGMSGAALEQQGNGLRRAVPGVGCGLSRGGCVPASGGHGLALSHRARRAG